MSTRDELEASLRARPDDATLAVYADYLQSQGDPRGELIALDLRPPDLSTNGLAVRRGQLLERWLGDDIDLLFDREQQLWYTGDLSSSFATFDCGFIEVVLTDFDYTADVLVPKLLGTRAGEYLRQLSLSGSSAMLEPAIDALVSRQRPWLHQLSITRSPYETPLLVKPPMAAALARVTPNLQVLDLAGRRLLDQFTHPTLRELGVVGSEAIDLADGPPLRALHTIAYQFSDAGYMPRGMFKPARVPALRRLDFSLEEPGGLNLFETLGTLGVADQLTHIILPAIRTEHDRRLVQAAIDRMPLLREITISRAYACHGTIPELSHAWARVKLPTPLPWPPHEMVDNVRLVIDGYETNLGEVVTLLDAHHLELPDDHHTIWQRFWLLLENLERSTYTTGYLQEQAFHAGDLVRVLAGLPLNSHLAGLYDHLRGRLERRPQGFFASLRWV